eukprot:TRINITY_DN1643_c4_g1_i2.p6 TRINITY_DN1643_c4_g1~~TRINITY_DN1643_c4_g1_i2.p6  ORF type:complete len:111 (+),score=2.04 TRINITY_DN1643_c4_g1_i2:841-1173(+)
MVVKKYQQKDFKNTVKTSLWRSSYKGFLVLNMKKSVETREKFWIIIFYHLQWNFFRNPLYLEFLFPYITDFSQLQRIFVQNPLYSQARYKVFIHIIDQFVACKLISCNEI